MSSGPDETPYLSLLKDAYLELKTFRAELDAIDQAKNEPIALIGMGCRFPGTANPQAFWELLHQGIHAVREVPADRWDIEALYDANVAAAGKMNTRWGGFLDAIDGFDAAFFGISPREAARIDPQQRLLLEVAWEALEDAGLAPATLAGSKTGVFVGVGNNEYSQIQFSDSAQIDAYAGTGNARSITANRLSYLLDLRGPSLVVDTACSSSLAAIHLACQSLRQREANLALAGGVSLMILPSLSITFSQAQMLAPDGRCKTFDAAADGYVRGEGCGVVVLKRLSDALAAGDTILALIRSSAFNQDGRSNGITAPNGPAQEAVMRQALAQAQIAPGHVSYVEAHGTGTPLGDPIELGAIGAAYGEGRAAAQPLMVGSVKTNIGHLEAAAGIAGVIKVVLALTHNEIPPHLHFHTPNPYIPWSRLPVVVPTTPTPWPAGMPRLAGINSFGFGGSNAHVIVGEAPSVAAPTHEQTPESGARPLHLLALSARDPQALAEAAHRYEGLLSAANSAISLPDLCYTATTRRSHFERRLALVAASNDEMRSQLATWQAQNRAAPQQEASAGAPPLAFLFTGQGSQYVGMGRQLYETQPTFRRTLLTCDEILRPHLPQPLLEVLFGSSASQLLDQTAYTQPALFALEMALAEVWRSWGLTPAAVLGHSVGEYAAACVAGVFSLEDGLRLVAARGRLMQELPAGGAMAALFTHEERAAAAIAPYGGRVTIAALNGAQETVISGEGKAVEQIMAALLTQGVQSRRLVVSHAFHSPLMAPMLAEFAEIAAQVSYQPPRLRVISNVSGTSAGAEMAEADYWVRHISAPVRFAQSIAALYGEGSRLFVEVGPKPVLAAMGQRSLPAAAEQTVWLPSLRAGIDDWQVILESLSALYVRGAAVDWAGFDRDYARTKTAVPTYPFQRQRYWMDLDGTIAPSVTLPVAAPRTETQAVVDPPVQAALGDVEWLAQLRSASGPERLARMVAYLCQEVGAILGLNGGRLPSPRQGFFDMGMDSLMGMQLKARVEQRLGVALPMTAAFDYPTIDQLSKYLIGDVLGLEATPPAAPLAQPRRRGEQAIAIIGLGCRLPGGANDPQGFWQLLRDGVDAVGEVPADRWPVDSFYDLDAAAAGKMYTRQGGFLDGAVDQFDAAFFGISPREAIHMDPQQRLLLEVAWEALEDAGQPPAGLTGSKTGVFVGINTNDYMQMIAWRQAWDIDAYVATGNTASIAAGRLSYFLGLQGPSLAIDTACSSSLVAVHLACQSLRLGECDLALAGGVNLMLWPLTSIGMSKLHALSPDGRCKSFAATADGYGRGEGCGVVVLKRLAAAEADGDPILAIIRGSAVNQDGPSSGLTVPNGPAQQALLADALASAGIAPADVDYVEAHGTGTPLGDPIELQALAAVLGRQRPAERPLVVGSVKTNFGHLEAAAGIAGLIKVVLALRHGEIPPHLHFDAPNPHLDWAALPVTIPTARRPWPRGERPRLAGVSSFGFSGTNAHVLIEEAGEAAIEASLTGAPLERPLHALALTAKSAPALRALARRYVDYLENEPVALTDLFYTANTGRSPMTQRLLVVAESAPDTQAKLAAWVAGDAPPSVISSDPARVQVELSPSDLVFMFTGQGSQYVGMGRQLYETQPTFRRTLLTCDEILRSHLPQPLLEVLFGSSGAKLLDQTAYTQPALFALEMALAEVWRSWGLTPTAVLGHSVGEYAAACVAGIFSLEDGLRLVAARGRLMQELPAGGAMAALFTHEEHAAAAIAPYGGQVAIAALNGPQETVISGEGKAVEQIIAALLTQGVQSRRLVVSHAFHSPLMAPMLAEFAKIAAQVSYHAPQIRLISNVSGTSGGAEMGEASYWVRHISAPVRFSQSIAALYGEGSRLFVEVGPKPVLAVMGQRVLPAAAEQTAWLPSLRAGIDDWQVILESLGALYVRGAAVDWAGFDRDYARTKTAAPTYPFQRRRFWIETPTPLTAENGKAAAGQEHDDWLYEVGWQPHPLPSLQDADTTEPGVWLIFADSGGIGTALAQRLAARGATPIRVEAGHSFVAHNSHYSIDPASAGDIQRLLAQTTANAPCRGVVYLWALDMVTPDAATEASPAELSPLTCAAPLYLVQALAAAAAPARLWLVSRGVQPAAGLAPEVAGLRQAPLWGLGRIIALEHPEVWGGLIDLDAVGDNQSDGQETEQEANRLLAELWRPDGEDQIAYRHDVRLAARLTRQERPAPPPPLHLRADAAYLITGGLGNLGLKLAAWMVERGARHLILTSRRGLPDRSQWDEAAADVSTAQAIAAIRQMEGRGAAVTVLAADVADQAQMAAAFAQWAADPLMPPLRGVVHAAGVLQPQPLLELEPANFEATLRPKAAGAWVLHKLTAQMELDFFVLYSSAASVWGSALAAHYATANHFLDIFAHYRRSLGLPALTVNWGWWADGGMVTEKEKAYFAAVGLEMMPSAAALDVLGELLAGRSVQTTVAPVEWSRYKPVFEAKRRRPFLELVGTQSEGASGGSAEAGDMRRLAAALPSERLALLVGFVQQEAGRVLHLEPGETVDPHEGFFQMGMDSLTSIELKNRLEARLGCNLPPTAGFEYPTSHALAEFIATDVLHMEVAEVAPLPAITPTNEAANDGANDGGESELAHLSEEELMALLERELGEAHR